MSYWNFLKWRFYFRNIPWSSFSLSRAKQETMSSKKLLSNKVYLQALGTESSDASPSLLLFTDSQRYLFNCGEGTQRLFNEQKIKYGKLSNIFFTQISWDYIGGLPGMAMTLRDHGRSNLGLYGPVSIKDFISATRFFLYHEKLQFDCAEYTGQQYEEYTDENLTIVPVVLHGTKPKAPMTTMPSNYNTSSYESQDDDHPSSPTKKIKLSLYPSSGTVVCYILKLVSVPGKFLLHKAKELHIPKGPLYGKLKNGEKVVLDDGTEILPEQVTEPPTPGPVIFIIHCPSSDLIPSLVNNEQLAAYHEGVAEGVVPPCLMVHLTPLDVYNDHVYRAWRDRYGNSTEHLIINKDVCADSLCFLKQGAIQCKLHTLDKEIFPLLHNSSTPKIPPSTLPPRTTPGEYGLQYHIRPTKQQGYDRSNIPEQPNRGAVIDEVRTMIQKNVASKSGVNALMDSNAILESENEERTAVDCKSDTKEEIKEVSTKDKCSMNLVTGNEDTTLECVQVNTSGALETHPLDISTHVEDKDYDFEAVFIGTGASLPSKYRNVSATLLNISDQTAMLLDCGEGTLGQLNRHYGNGTDDVIRRIKCVFISHIHADHHLGLPRLLLRKTELGNKPALVIGPTKIHNWLQEYSTMCEELHFRFQDCNSLEFSDTKFLASLEANEVSAVPVDHCAFAYGLVLSHVTGWKVVYSGDTRPCERLVQAGSDATLLIHEATFEDGLETEAIDKKHSTTTEAITSGLGMSARFIMLNHFSQRYPKIPVFSDKFTRHTGIAFDHMAVRPRDFRKIPSFLPLLKVLFAEEVEELTLNTESRRNKQSVT